MASREAKTSTAFSPSAISTFFGVAGATPRGDLSKVGATGGGFVLSKGVYSTAAVRPRPQRPVINVTVNGDPNYDAFTTRRAVQLLLAATGREACRVDLEQKVELPIGYGFGTSAASSLSAVVAVASALGLTLPKERVAYFAHAAEILSGTGLGTVSAIYNHAGAGIIRTPGGPGLAEVVPVPVPKGALLVAVSVSPMKKGRLLSSREMREKVRGLGEEALLISSSGNFADFLLAGEFFTESVGLDSPAVKRLIDAGKRAGAMGAGQNMIGDAMYSVVWADDAAKVSKALSSESPSSRVDVIDVGNVSTGVVGSASRRA